MQLINFLSSLLLTRAAIPTPSSDSEVSMSDLTKRAGTITCSSPSNWGPAVPGDGIDSVAYMIRNAHQSKCWVGPGPGTCRKLVCSQWDSRASVWLCNDRREHRNIPCWQIADYVESVGEVCASQGRRGYGQSRNVAEGWLVIAAGTKAGEGCTNSTILDW